MDHHNFYFRPGGKSQFDSEALAIKAHLQNRAAAVRSDVNANNGSGEAAKNRNWGRYDSSALHIQHALKQTAVQKKYYKPHAQAINTFLV
jgi:hypothetical protein